MTFKALGLGLATVLVVTASASACGFHDTVAESKTPVDYSKLKMMDVAQIPVDAWLIKYLDEWQKA
jgi:hypothetical protein